MNVLLSAFLQRYIHKRDVYQTAISSLHVITQDLANIFLHNLFPVFFQMYMFLPGFEGLLWNILEMNNIVFANDKK